MYQCLHGTAPLYMMESCTQTADVVSRLQLRSASQRKMIVPRYRLDSYSRRRCFAVAGQSTWNLLPDSLHDPASPSIFRRYLKTHFLCEILTRCTSRITDFFYKNALYKFTLYLLTYLLAHPAPGYSDWSGSVNRMPAAAARIG